MRGIAQPGLQLLGDAIGDLGVARDPDQAFAAGVRERRGEVRLRAVRHLRVGDVTQVLADPALAHRPEAVDERLELAGPGQQAGECRQIGQATATVGATGRRTASDLRRAARRPVRRCRGRASARPRMRTDESVIYASSRIARGSSRRQPVERRTIVGSVGS